MSHHSRIGMARPMLSQRLAVKAKAKNLNGAPRFAPAPTPIPPIPSTSSPDFQPHRQMTVADLSVASVDGVVEVEPRTLAVPPLIPAPGPDDIVPVNGKIANGRKMSSATASSPSSNGNGNGNGAAALIQARASQQAVELIQMKAELAQRDAEIRALRAQSAEQDARLRSARADLMEAKAAAAEKEAKVLELYNVLADSSTEKAQLREDLARAQMELVETRDELESLADEILAVRDVLDEAELAELALFTESDGAGASTDTLQGYADGLSSPPISPPAAAAATWQALQDLAGLSRQVLNDAIQDEDVYTGAGILKNVAENE